MSFADSETEDILLSEETLSLRIAELGAQITVDYAGKQLVAIGVLNGAAMFLADLVRHIDLPLEVEFVTVSSYGKETKSSGKVNIHTEMYESYEGKHLLVVEDILDSGQTLSFLVNLLKLRNPGSVECCVLLDKPERREFEVTPRYTGFVIENRFVCGYGLDYQGIYRNLPYVAVLKSVD